MCDERGVDEERKEEEMGKVGVVEDEDVAMATIKTALRKAAVE